MAILDLKEKIEPFRKNATGYVKQLLSANHVVMSDGTTLQTKMDSLNSAISGIERIYAHYLVATFKSANTLYVKYNLDDIERSLLDAGKNAFPFVQLVTTAGTPYPTPAAISVSSADTIKNNGYVEIEVNASGYVNGHLLGLYLFILFG